VGRDARVPTGAAGRQIRTEIDLAPVEGVLVAVIITVRAGPDAARPGLADGDGVADGAGLAAGGRAAKGGVVDVDTDLAAELLVLGAARAAAATARSAGGAGLPPVPPAPPLALPPVPPAPPLALPPVPPAPPLLVFPLPPLALVVVAPWTKESPVSPQATRRLRQTPVVRSRWNRIEALVSLAGSALCTGHRLNM
jgi:hypothetical protein